MATQHALVTGAHGIVGLNLVQELAGRSDWKVTATGRRASLPVPDVDYVAADLAEAEACAPRSQVAVVSRTCSSGPSATTPILTRKLRSTWRS
jgi:NAD(P)-dependent dehydrogenase (short-subunit alcohol dehydrogenase family)